ncbi:glycosyltransferase family 4 protein [Corynebacterium kozikiae]|uniref:glycosyltransferase family 4 protein n=1 Tax=Corynebacterium kozikiae TaxID=2968469 RepID=UPI00211CBFD6|nr:glycosyltransferase family 4 protein [Corynebacterium sp. 76QC2CO]MCQ9342504.1 glycosyltransferase family 4 protein [Corynebacterium sp. 76QC2CO]
MRIGIVCPYSFDEPGGVQAHILDLAQILIRRGHQVQVIGPCSAKTQVPEFVTKGGRSIPIPYNGSVARLAFGPQVFRRVRSFIQQGDFDVLHIHEPNSPSFSLAALRLARGPIVATYHASSSGSKLLKVALPLLRGSLEKIRGGIAVSEMARRWQVEQLGGDPVLIPNGVDTQVYRQALVDVGTAAPAQERPVEIAFLGRLGESRKGLQILLDSLRYLARPATITVMGGGTPPPLAPNQVSPGVEVRFAGRVSDEEKARLLAQADIYVAPNTGGESFGIVLVEAMAAGCAVVASDLEAFAAVCDAQGEQPAGMLFRNGDPKDLARVLRSLIDSPQKRADLQRAGELRAQLYDWERVATLITRVYETVVADEKVEA